MSAMTTLAPSSTRRRAMALPISPAPPVTTTTLSCTEIGHATLLTSGWQGRKEQGDEMSVYRD